MFENKILPNPHKITNQPHKQKNHNLSFIEKGKLDKVGNN
jgi:hypothetical protein